MEELTVRAHLDDQHVERLVAFLTSDEWPFHVVRRPRAQQVGEWIAADRYGTLLWIESNGQAVGFINVEEPDHFTPAFDLRVASAWRGRGVGRWALKWLAGYVFDTLDKTRVEGYTRGDNAAMRKVFETCGWVREGHYRRAWPDDAGAAYDSVSYALLRDDWRNRTTTPVSD
ncbi:MAG: GNAT family N-acetyltransferase [Planctomycetota bacterium]|jgi:RimJ/RimL family protein N-acetyltransferase